MKVLTVWSPWSSLIAAGAKPYEFRRHAPPKGYVGQRIAIHAGKKLIEQTETRRLLRQLESPLHAWRTCLVPEIAIPILEQALRAPETLPLGVVLCTAMLGQARDGFDIAREFGGKINDSTRMQHANFGWPLTDIELVIPPDPHRGMQGWSEWTP